MLEGEIAEWQQSALDLRTVRLHLDARLHRHISCVSIDRWPWMVQCSLCSPDAPGPGGTAQLKGDNLPEIVQTSHSALCRRLKGKVLHKKLAFGLHFKS
ncbi:hypothetical protein GN956_G13597 [Arapaima gigas]